MAEETPEKELIVEEAVEAAAAPDPLDHDTNGKKGGSQKGPASTRAKGAAKRAAKKADDANKVWIVLEENADIPPTGLFLGHNGIGAMVVAGEPVHLDKKYVEILDQAETSVPYIDPSTQKVLSHRRRLRFPYRRVDAPVVD